MRKVIGNILIAAFFVVMGALIAKAAFAQGQPSPQEQLQSCSDQAAVISKQREQALNEQAAVVANALALDLSTQTFSTSTIQDAIQALRTVAAT